jgi:hypothetical protein
MPAHDPNTLDCTALTRGVPCGTWAADVHNPTAEPTGSNTTGWPSISTRVEPAKLKLTCTQGLGGWAADSEQPATTVRSAVVIIGAPPASTRNWCGVIFTIPWWVQLTWLAAVTANPGTASS